MKYITKQFPAYFLQGFLALLPLAISLYVLSLLVRLVSGITGASLVFLPASLQNMTIVVIMVKSFTAFAIIGIILLLGYRLHGMAGKIIIERLDKIIASIPAVNIIYRTTRQIIDLFSIRKDSNLMKPVMVEWPSDGRWAIAFVTGSAPAAEDGIMLNTIFMPTSPNPTSGYLLLLPQEKIRKLDMPFEAAMKMVLTAGMVRS